MSKNLGDKELGTTFDFKFPTVKSTGAPTTLSGTPVVSCFVGNGTTPITAGITLTVDFAGKVGLNNVRVVLTAANGYARKTDLQFVITTGTVDSVSVVGYEVATATCENVSIPGVTETGTATAFTGTTLSLATGQTYETDALKSSVLYIKDAATGKGQSWLILSNTNATPSVCIIDGTFAPTLTGTPFYQILAAPKYPSDYYARFANAINDDAIDVIQTYARASNLAATIDKSTGTETLTLTTDATFLPIKSVT